MKPPIRTLDESHPGKSLYQEQADDEAIGKSPRAPSTPEYSLLRATTTSCQIAFEPKGHIHDPTVTLTDDGHGDW